MKMTDLLRAEVRRALHRRNVWVLVALAFVGIVALGLIAFFDSAGRTVAEMSSDGTHPSIMRDWFVDGGGDGILLIAAVPLFIGGLLGGAFVAGAEWRAGTVTTALTWEPRRLRLHAARMGTVFVLAALFSLALQVLFLSAALPAVFTHGTTAGLDGAWWLALFGAVGRIAFLTAAAALLGSSLATLGRGTAFALGGVFGWMAVVEPMLRGLRPKLQPFLLGENMATVAQWAPLEGMPFDRSAVEALALVCLYLGAIAAVASMSFARRDVAAVS